MPNFKGWEILIVVAIILLLFGAKRLPDLARSTGRSLRIFKAETKDLVESGKDTAKDVSSTVATTAVEAGKGAVDEMKSAIDDAKNSPIDPPEPIAAPEPIDPPEPIEAR